jgi:methionyl aminopeptidase
MIKQSDELAYMAESGRLLTKVFGFIDTLSLIGMTTMQVNDLVEDYIRNTLQARPASKGQYGFQYVLNSSPNDVVCHGVPSTADILQDGDIVNFDVTLEKNGYIADSSKMYLVGNVSEAAQTLVRVTYDAL